MIRKIYKKLRDKSTPKQQALLSKIAFASGMSPTVKRESEHNKDNFLSPRKGGFVISADFEMAWAFRYSKRDVNPIAMANLERENIPELLRLFELYNIPITWATVGHLFLESCKKRDHDWMRRIPHFDDHWKFISGDWYAHDPYTDYRKDSAWYAPDLVETILKSYVTHEFGCHTFSHMDCSDKNCPAGVLDDEIQACKDAASKWGITMQSLVFPGGTAGNYQVLQKHGFTIYRKNINYDLAFPFRDSLGMLITPSTSSFGRNCDWEADYYIFRFKKMIDKAIRTNTVAHIWLHPSVDKWTLANVIPAVLKYAAQRRDDGLLWIGTMGQIADLINHTGN